jgi:hypothetical protein
VAAAAGLRTWVVVVEEAARERQLTQAAVEAGVVRVVRSMLVEAVQEEHLTKATEAGPVVPELGS